MYKIDNLTLRDLESNYKEFGKMIKEYKKGNTKQVLNDLNSFITCLCICCDILRDEIKEQEQ